MPESKDYEVNKTHILVAAIALALNVLLGILINIRSPWIAKEQSDMDEREPVGRSSAEKEVPGSESSEYRPKKSHAILAALTLVFNTLFGVWNACTAVRQTDISEQSLVSQTARLEYVIFFECQSPAEGTLVEWLEVRNTGGARAEDVRVSISNTGMEVSNAFSDYPHEEFEPEVHKGTSVRVPTFPLDCNELYKLKLEMVSVGGVESEDLEKILVLQTEFGNLQVTTGSNNFEDPNGIIQEPRGFPEHLTHTVKDSDTVYSIAELYGLNVDTLIAYNPAIDLFSTTPITPGQRLVVQQPVCGQLTTASVASPQNYGALGYHVVQNDETLYCIARAYGVDPWALVTFNGITSLEELSPGLALVIPNVPAYIPPGPVCPAQFSMPTYPVTTCTAWHMVAPGDSLYSIALYYGVSMWQIASVNGISDLNDPIRAGDSLCIP